MLTWACTDDRLAAIAPFYGAAPRPRAAVRRMCPVVGSWPGKDFTTKAAGILETELTAAGIPHNLKVYPGAKMRGGAAGDPAFQDVASSAELFRVSARYRRPPVWGDIHVTLTPEGSGSTCVTARAMAFPNLFALIFSPERRIIDQFARALR